MLFLRCFDWVLENALEELAELRKLRMVEYLIGGSVLGDPTLIHEEDTVGNLAGKAHLVCDADHRHSLGGKLEHREKHEISDQKLNDHRCSAKESDVCVAKNIGNLNDGIGLGHDLDHGDQRAENDTDDQTR